MVIGIDKFQFIEQIQKSLVERPFQLNNLLQCGCKVHKGPATTLFFGGN